MANGLGPPAAERAPDRSDALQDFNLILGRVIYGTHVGEVCSPIDTATLRRPSAFAQRNGETQVADQLVAERPVTLTEDRPSRRTLKIKQIDAKMVRAIAAVNVRHLGRGPRKRAR